MKKVLIFSMSYYPKFVGGAEVSIKEITDRIDDIEFHLITNRYDTSLPKEALIGNVQVHRIGITTKQPSIADLKRFPLSINKLLYQFLAVWRARSLHREHRFNAIWGMMAHSAGVPSALFTWMYPEVKYVLNLQEGDPPAHIEKTMRPLWPLFTRAFTKADIIQVLSTYLGRWARRRGFTGEIVVIPNAVNSKRFSAPVSEMRLNEIKDKLGKRMGDVFLITTSRLVYKNAVDDVIQALSYMPSNIRFLIAGIGPEEQNLRELARTCSVSERVVFLGEISHADMPAYLQASDIFIRPSRSEGFGASFPEAMAAGLPVIATQEGGIADFLFDEKRNPERAATGFAVDTNSPKQIAAVVSEVMTHTEKTRAIVRTARAMVQEKYDWDIIARRMRTEVFARLGL